MISTLYVVLYYEIRRHVELYSLQKSCLHPKQCTIYPVKSLAPYNRSALQNQELFVDINFLCFMRVLYSIKVTVRPYVMHCTSNQEPNSLLYKCTTILGNNYKFQYRFHAIAPYIVHFTNEPYSLESTLNAKKSKISRELLCVEVCYVTPTPYRVKFMSSREPCWGSVPDSLQKCTTQGAQ